MHMLALLYKLSLFIATHTTLSKSDKLERKSNREKVLSWHMDSINQNSERIRYRANKQPNFCAYRREGEKWDTFGAYASLR